MTIATSKALTLAKLLHLPETEPASEFVNGQVIQKPIPQGKHSRLQLKLAEAINQVTEEDQIALAFPELRCTFGGRSLVPNIAIFAWERIPFETDGEVSNGFGTAPDWTIEILSPEQSQTRVMEKILFCLQHETRLGWLIDPQERAVICYQPDRLPEIKQGDNQLPVLAKVNLSLTVTELFGWLKVGRTAG